VITPAPAVSLLIRPTFTTYRAAYLSPATVGGALVTFTVLSIVSWPKAGALVPVLIVIMVVAATAYIALYLRNTRIELRDGHVLETTAFGRTREHAISEVSRLVFVEHLIAVQNAKSPADASRNLFLVDADGRRIARASGAAWSIEDLDALVIAFEGREVSRIGAISSKDFVRQFPHLLPWAERHPWGFAWLVAVPLVAVIGLVIYLAVR
jgi:hypothetical protein